MDRRDVAIAGHSGDERTARLGLGSDDGSVRSTALGALARMGRLIADDLRLSLGDTDPRVRRRAAELAKDHPEVDLLGALDDRDPLVAEAAAYALGERPADPDVVAALSTVATGHSDALVREAAIAALGSIGDEAGLPAILRGTTDKPTVRRRAVLALAPFEGDEVDAALQRALTDRDWQVRQAAEDLLEYRP
ncbi:MAG TPA: HEAT repeat domain-containing protein [Acidimicrobiales bacterium]|nr:HEAT repeat domain-containing protein [Acidimicrobiales bacterium]